MKQFFLFALAAVGAYAIWEWYSKNPRSSGGPNPVAAEVAGIAQPHQSYDSLTSGIPTFNATAIANGHGDQVSAAYHSNRYSTSNGSASYTPAFGPKTNR